MTLRLNGSTSGYTEIDAPAVAGNNTLILPGGNGTSGQVLTTNGSGTLSWADRMTAAGPAFSAKPDGAGQSLPASILTKVLFNTEEFDTANCFAGSRFTPNVAGYYQINAVVSAAATVLVNLHKNGSLYKRGLQNTQQSTGISCLVYLNGTTDYVEVFALNATTNTVNSDPAISYFDGFLARPA